MSLDKLSPLERKKLGEFRKKVEPLLTKDEYKQDHFLVRWLLARDMDLIKAEEMLKRSLEWRTENGADDVFEREEIPEKFRKRFMFGVVGEDSEGFPILLLPTGRHDHRFMIEEVGLEQCFKWNIVWMERIMKILADFRAKSGKPVYQLHEIIDMEGYSIRQLGYKPSIDYIMATQAMFDANYPEVMRSITVINAPKIFPIFFNLMKPMITKHMLEKINVFGCKQEEWVQFFKEKFPMDKFPRRWGGSLPGEDEFSSQESIWVDGPIPLRYFREVEGEDEDGFTTVKVAAREKFKLDIEIPEKGTRLEYKFQTELHDIAFGLIFSLPGAVDIPLGRVPSQKEMQEGKVVCGGKGTCTFIFDNRFSYTTPKTLRYRIELISP